MERRIVQGTKDKVEHLIKRTQGKGMINTAFIERLSATFRQRISSLMRLTRTLVQQAKALMDSIVYKGNLGNIMPRYQLYSAMSDSLCHLYEQTYL